MNRIIKIPVVFALGLGLTLALLWLLGIVTSSPTARAADLSHHAAAPGDVYCVTPESGSYVGCTQVFTNVQAAVDAASGGETIKVATGVYTDISAREGITQVVYLSKTVTIQGGYTTTNWTMPFPITQPTTLDAQGQGRVVYIAGNISPTIEGLRITNGNARGLPGGYPVGWGGGGVYLEHGNARFSANTIVSNTAGMGGGVYLYYGTATLNNNAVLSNTADCCGGGLLSWYSIITVSGNIIRDNTSGSAEEGGGVAVVHGEATLTGNVISDNTSEDSCGGVYLGSDDATINGNIILSNAAEYYGGGICLVGHSTVSDNIISGNVVSRSNGIAVGGGVFIGGCCAAQVELVNNVITDNRINSPDGDGSGVWIASYSNVHLVHTTIARNTGGDGSGIWESGSTVALTNTVIVSQTVGITATSDSNAALNGVLWFDNGANTGGPGTIAVTHEITGDPAFAPDGYHLTAGSAAIDQGVDAGVTTDIDGEHRPQGPAPDLGADEISLSYIYLPLVLR
jgi:fibronectin-binding autotransporter adhesin